MHFRKGYIGYVLCFLVFEFWSCTIRFVIIDLFEFLVYRKCKFQLLMSLSFDSRNPTGMFCKTIIVIGAYRLHLESITSYIQLKKKKNYVSNLKGKIKLLTQLYRSCFRWSNILLVICKIKTSNPRLHKNGCLWHVATYKDVKKSLNITWNEGSLETH